MALSRIGFGQVEPNHLSGIVEGRILAQLPVDQTKMGKIIENGRFAKYDLADGVVTTDTGRDTKLPYKWMLIYNEEKLYDERKQNHKDFAMIAKNYTGGTGKFIDSENRNYFSHTYDGGEIYPRLIGIEEGDLFTTNCLEVGNTSDDAVVSASGTYAVGDTVGVGTDGYLTKTSFDADGPQFVVVKVYTMADMQTGIKLQCVSR